MFLTVGLTTRAEETLSLVSRIFPVSPMIDTLGLNIPLARVPSIKLPTNVSITTSCPVWPATYSFLNEERICYKKDWLTSPFEIGQDMLQEEMGIEFHYYWDQLYVAVPITKTDIIKFFDDNVPNWVITVKRI